MFLFYAHNIVSGAVQATEGRIRSLRSRPGHQRLSPNGRNEVSSREHLSTRKRLGFRYRQGIESQTHQKDRYNHTKLLRTLILQL